MLRCIAKTTTLQVLTQRTARLACRVEGSTMPEPIIVQNRDMAHALDESLSCHMSVAQRDCGKANYR